MTKEKEIQISVSDDYIDEVRQEFKIPFACPICNKLMENWDTRAWYAVGACMPCKISFVDDRELPSELLRDRKALRAHMLDLHKNSDFRK